MPRRRGNGIGYGIGTGSGWGGPARGAGSGAARHPEFEPGKQVAACGHNRTRAERAADLSDHLFELAMTAPDQATQVSAAEAWLDRFEGRPQLRKEAPNG